MRILVYKRTHISDPDPDTLVFGNRDCMGRVRNYAFDAVIGVGGIGAQPRRHGIDRRLTWIGLEPARRTVPRKKGPEIRFGKCTIWNDRGPALAPLAPRLARRLFEGGARFLLLDSEGKDAPLFREAAELLADYRRARLSRVVPSEPNSTERSRRRTTGRRACRP